MSRRHGGRTGRRGNSGRPPDVLLLSFTDPSATFTRSSEASYYLAPPGGAASTFIAWAGSNALRYDAIDGVALALFEGSQSNLCPYSEDLSNAAWVKTGASISGTTGTAPDGASDLCTVSFTASATDSLMQQVTGTADATTYFSTVFVRRTTGSGNVRWQLANRAGTTTQSSDIAIDTTWKRIEFSSAWGTGATTPQIGLINASAGGTQSVEVWGFDVKASAAIPTPTSYIRTTATSATRNQDVLTYSTTTPSRLVAGKWQFALRPLYATAETPAARGACFTFSSSADDCINIFTNATQALAAGVTQFTKTALSYSRHQALTITPDLSANTLTVAGATAGNGTGAAGTAPGWGTAHLRIGSTSTGRPLYARIGEPYAAT